MSPPPSSTRPRTRLIASSWLWPRVEVSGWALLVALWLVCALGWQGEAQALTPDELEAARADLTTGSLEQRLTSVQALASDPSPETTQALSIATRDPNVEVRRLAIHALRGREVSAERWRALLDDEEVTVRVAALAAIDDPSLRALILQRLKDDEEVVRLIAVERLLVIGVTPQDRCGLLLVQWRALAARSIDDSDLTREALAMLLLASPDDFVRCSSEPGEVEHLQRDRARYQVHEAQPEVSFLIRGWVRRLRALRETLDRIGAGVDEELRRECEAAILQDPDKIGGRGVTIINGLESRTRLMIDGAHPASSKELNELRAALERVELLPGDLVQCYKDPTLYHGGNPNRGNGGGARRERYFWGQLAAITRYDSHFLARRSDVDHVRVTDQVSQRAAVQVQLTSEKQRLGVDPLGDDDLYFRARGELGADIFFGESQLSGPEGILDLWGSYRLNDENFVYTSFDFEHRRGFVESQPLDRMLMPHTHGALALGYRLGEPFKLPDIVVQLSAGFERYHDPTSAEEFSSALIIDQPSATLRPRDEDWAGKQRYELRAQSMLLNLGGSREEIGVMLDGGVQLHHHPYGFPGLNALDEEVLRDAHLAVTGHVEPGLLFSESRRDHGLLGGWIGASFLKYPDPSTETLAMITGSLVAGFWEDDRSKDGFVLMLHVGRNLLDSPDLMDAIITNGGEMLALVWEESSDLFVEGGSKIMFRYNERLGAGDPSLGWFDGGARLFFYVQGEELPGLMISWELTITRDDARLPALWRSRGINPSDEEPQEIFFRNVFMIHFYVPLGGSNVDFIEARQRPRELRFDPHPILPPGWPR